MINIKDFGNVIEIYNEKRLLITIVEEDWGIEVYDYINHQYLNVNSFFIRGALDEIISYLGSIIR